jgi:hypothetical protein
MDRGNDSVVKRKILVVLLTFIYCDVIIVVKDDRKFRHISTVLVYKKFYWKFDHG